MNSTMGSIFNEKIKKKGAKRKHHISPIQTHTNYPTPQVKAIPITKLPTTFLNSPTQNYNSFPPQLLSLYFFLFLKLSTRKVFFLPTIVQANSHPPGTLSCLMQSFVWKLCFISLFIYLFIYLFICCNSLWMMRKHRERGGTYRFFFFLGFHFCFIVSEFLQSYTNCDC